MKKEKYSAHNFIGKVFMPNQIDENKTYTAAIQEMENDPVFQKFTMGMKMNEQAWWYLDQKTLCFGMESWLMTNKCLLQD